MSVLIKGQTLVVKRYPPLTRTGGLTVRGTPTTFNITGTVQPTTGEKVQTLLEGKRVQGIVEIFTDQRLQLADPVLATPNDFVTWDGADWEVIALLGWSNGVFPHYEYVAVRLKEGTR